MDKLTDKILDAGTTTLVNSLKRTLENPDFMQSSFGKFLTAFGAGAIGGAVVVYTYEKYFNPNRVSQQDIAELKLLVQQNTLQQQQLQNHQGGYTQQQPQSNKVVDVSPENT